MNTVYIGELLEDGHLSVPPEFKKKYKVGDKFKVQVTKTKEQSSMRHVYPVESIDCSTGPPSTIPFIPYGRQSIDEKDVAAVCSVLRSDWLTQGPKIKEFEDVIASYSGAKFAVAVSSGTAALHIACLAAGLGKDDTLWTSPNAFVASANCALYCGAKPDFVDINSLKYKIGRAHV